MKPIEAIQSDIAELLRGIEFVKPLESQAGKANLVLLDLELELAPFQFYRDEGIVLKVPGNPTAKGGCIPIIDKTNYTSLIQIRYVETEDPIENIAVRSHEEAEAAILLGKSHELRELLAMHNLPVDEAMQKSKARLLDKLLLNGQACFALGHKLPSSYCPIASRYIEQLKALPHDEAKESLCNLATVAAMDIKGISRSEFASWYNARAYRVK